MTCPSKNNGIGRLLLYLFLVSFRYRCIYLQTNRFIVLKESVANASSIAASTSQRWTGKRYSAWLSIISWTIIALFYASWRTMCGDLGLKMLKNIQIVPVRFVGLVVISIGWVLGSGRCPDFCKRPAKLHLRRSVKDRRCRSHIVYVRLHFFDFDVWCCPCHPKRWRIRGLQNSFQTRRQSNKGRILMNGWTRLWCVWFSLIRWTAFLVSRCFWVWRLRPENVSLQIWLGSRTQVRSWWDASHPMTKSLQLQHIFNLEF